MTVLQMGCMACTTRAGFASGGTSEKYKAFPAFAHSLISLAKVPPDYIASSILKIQCGTRMELAAEEHPKYTEECCPGSQKDREDVPIEIRFFQLLLRRRTPRWNWRRLHVECESGVNHDIVTSHAKAVRMTSKGRAIALTGVGTIRQDASLPSKVVGGP